MILLITEQRRWKRLWGAWAGYVDATATWNSRRWQCIGCHKFCGKRCNWNRWHEVLPHLLEFECKYKLISLISRMGTTTTSGNIYSECSQLRCSSIPANWRVSATESKTFSEAWRPLLWRNWGMQRSRRKSWTRKSSRPISRKIREIWRWNRRVYATHRHHIIVWPIINLEMDIKH